MIRLCKEIDMSDSFRIEVNEIDRSQTVKPNVGTNGAMIVRSLKGPVGPIFVSKGDEERILNLYGKPSVLYPDVWEAIQFNKEAAIWMSAPSGSGSLLGGVLITELGTVSLDTGISEDSVDSYTFSNVVIPQEEIVGTGTGAQAIFSLVLSHDIDDPENSLDIELDGIPMVITVGPAVAGVYPITHANLTSGSYDSNTQTIDLEFSGGNEPALAVVISTTYDGSIVVYAALFNRGPINVNDMSAKVVYNTNTGFYEITLSILKDSLWKEIGTFITSFVPNTKDGFGKNIYLEEIFENSDWIRVKANTAVTAASFVDDITAVTFAGQVKIVATPTEITAAWNQFQQKTKYPAHIFMDTTADPAIPAIFDTLRSTYQKYSSYIMPLPIGDDWADSIITKNDYSIDNRGLAFYWNFARIRDTYNNSSFWTSLIGRVGQKFAQMRNVFNGLAPAWIDENSHGGQLGSGIIEMEFDPSEDALKALDDAGINPISFDTGYGVMVKSQRTAQSPNKLSDASWIAHSRLFDYIISNHITQVLTYQLVKLNDPLHRNMAIAKSNSITDPIVAQSLLLEVKAKCDDGNNTSDMLAQRKFVFTLGVKVTPFSETIIFNFVNVSQTTTVEEVIG